MYIFTAKLYKFEVNADILLNTSETIHNPEDFKLYYTLSHKNKSFSEKYSLLADFNSENNEFLNFKITKLRFKNRMKTIRLDFAGIHKNYTLRSFLGCSVFDSECNSDFKFVETIYPEIWVSDNAELKQCRDSILQKRLTRLYHLTDRL